MEPPEPCASPEIPFEGVLVESKTCFGPVPVGDDDLLPLVGRLVAVMSSSGMNLLKFVSGKDDELSAARRLAGLIALGAAGELRALVVLCTTDLPIFGRIHLRSIDDCVRRIAVYFSDHAFAKATAESLPNFQADGFAKLSDDFRKRIAAREDEFTARFDAIMAAKKPPLKITEHSKYKAKPIAGLDEFDRWAYSQVEHCSPIALAGFSNRLSTQSEQIYATGESVQLLIPAIGMSLNILAHLASFGVDVRNEINVLQERLAGVLRRSGLLADDDIQGSAGAATASM